MAQTKRASTEPTLEHLTVEECWALLAAVPIGRVAVSYQGEAPLVVPVNHLVHEQTILFRSGPGLKVEAMREAPVSFQSDGVDPFHRTGWSVLVRGVATFEGIAELDAAPLPWTDPSDRRRLVRIWPAYVSGRRITVDAFDWDPQGYL